MIFFNSASQQYYLNSLLTRILPVKDHSPSCIFFTQNGEDIIRINILLNLVQVCVQNHRGFQDISSLVAVADTYATTEPFIEGIYDIRIQKIGENYRVFK